MAGALISGAVRIAAIDFAHRQSRHFVLSDRAYFAADLGTTDAERHRKVTTGKTFADLGVAKPLIEVLAAGGITHPFPDPNRDSPRHARRPGRPGPRQDRQRKDARLLDSLVSRLLDISAARADRRVWCLPPPGSWPPRSAAALEPLAAVNGLRVDDDLRWRTAKQAGGGAEIRRRHSRGLPGPARGLDEATPDQPRLD